jgi:hypothetical protein
MKINPYLSFRKAVTKSIIYMLTFRIQKKNRKKVVLFSIEKKMWVFGAPSFAFLDSIT